MILHLAMFFLKLQAGYSMELMILIISCGRSLYLLAPLRKSRKRLVKVTLIFLEQKTWVQGTSPGNADGTLMDEGDAKGLGWDIVGVQAGSDGQSVDMKLDETDSSKKLLLIGGTGDDTITGGSKKDIIVGGDGDDKIYGDEGEDILVGGNGNDILDGGDGKAIYAGGTGADKFVFGPHSKDSSILDGAADDQILVRIFKKNSQTSDAAINLVGGWVTSKDGGHLEARFDSNVFHEDWQLNLDTNADLAVPFGPAAKNVSYSEDYNFSFKYDYDITSGTLTVSVSNGSGRDSDDVILEKFYQGQYGINFADLTPRPSTNGVPSQDQAVLTSLGR